MFLCPAQISNPPQLLFSTTFFLFLQSSPPPLGRGNSTTTCRSSSGCWWGSGSLSGASPGRECREKGLGPVRSPLSRCQRAAEEREVPSLTLGEALLLGEERAGGTTTVPYYVVLVVGPFSPLLPSKPCTLVGFLLAPHQCGVPPPQAVPSARNVLLYEGGGKYVEREQVGERLLLLLRPRAGPPPPPLARTYASVGTTCARAREREMTVHANGGGGGGGRGGGGLRLVCLWPPPGFPFRGGFFSLVVVVGNERTKEGGGVGVGVGDEGGSKILPERKKASLLMLRSIILLYYYSRVPARTQRGGGGGGGGSWPPPSSSLVRSLFPPSS